jgi:hypothetical protein
MSSLGPTKLHAENLSERVKFSSFAQSLPRQLLAGWSKQPLVLDCKPTAETGGVEFPCGKSHQVIELSAVTPKT